MNLPARWLLACVLLGGAAHAQRPENIVDATKDNTFEAPVVSELFSPQTDSTIDAAGCCPRFSATGPEKAPSSRLNLLSFPLKHLVIKLSGQSKVFVMEATNAFELKHPALLARLNRPMVRRVLLQR